MTQKLPKRRKHQPKTHCGKCHQCDTSLKTVLDGEEYCPRCKAYRRYLSHGWSLFAADGPSQLYCPTTKHKAK